jgi:histidinol-phosphate phosphatase family protein
MSNVLESASYWKNITYVFLDRDGVLNRPPPPGQYVTCCDDFALLPGVEEAVAALDRSGRKVIVVTNQRGIALGLYSMDELARMHDLLRQRLAASGAYLDAIYVCPHDEGECNCRKPLTGLFEQAFRDFPGARAENSIMVGDSLRDIEAGSRLRMATVFVDGSAAESPAAQLKDAQQARSLADVCVTSLADLVRAYLCGK